MQRNGNLQLGGGIPGDRGKVCKNPPEDDLRQGIQHLSVTVQKVLYGTDTDLHGARLDIYVEPEGKEPDGKAAVYDIEPDRKDSATDKKALPRRVRFYHGKIAARSLNSGIGYDELKM